MNLTESQMATLFSTGVNLKNAKVLADLISHDPTVGGIFPNGTAGDLAPDEQKFKSKCCKWWIILEPQLQMAKFFTIASTINLFESNSSNVDLKSKGIGIDYIFI